MKSIQLVSSICLCCCLATVQSSNLNPIDSTTIHTSSNNNGVTRLRRQQQQQKQQRKTRSQRHESNLSSSIHSFSSSASPSQRHLSVWGFLLNIIHHHCPPGPLGKHCREHHDDHAGKTGGDNRSGDGTTASASTSSDSSGTYSGDSSTSANSSNYNGNDDGSGANGNDGGFKAFMTSSVGQIALITIAAVAASIAIAAMYISNRPNGNQKKHPLNGIIKKRVGLFSRMAERTNCATCRPEKLDDQVVTQGDYRLA